MTITELKKQFTDIFGENGEDLRVFYSAGRVNLIGEHTDATGGYVFPAAISLGTTIIARKRNDNKICLAASDLPDRPVLSIDKLESYKELGWGNYQAGVLYEMAKDGYKIVGADLLFDDTVPHGAGLSSSAAIEVATAVMAATFSAEAKGEEVSLDSKYLAVVSQRAENKYIGVNCGIMDQFASSMGKKDNAIFLNCKTLDFSLIPLEMKGYKIILANTNKKRSLMTCGYNERRADTENGFNAIKDYLNVSCLGEVTPAMLETVLGKLTDENMKKRVTHVVYENERVLKSVEALKEGNLALFGELMKKSHDSLRDLYEVTGKELDTLYEEALKIEGVIGSRMTGAGFGGCTVSIVPENKVAEFIETVGAAYSKETGLVADFYVCEIGDGGREIK